MSPAVRLAVNEGFAGQTERRKRLGQYFTGVGLARLLAALAGAERMKSAIDPMAGSGDMLAACVELGAKPEFLSAVDIDPCAQRTCSERIQEARCVLGSAFDTDALSLLPRRQWDLVITNPPYVRYQSMSRGAGKGIRLPSAMEVRNGLLKVLDNIDALDDTDRVLFQKMATGYSGLADFAVPSWILCAALVAPGGSLALVVPESWLSRDYAAVVHYLLLRWFKIEFVVEDEHAAWFSDAQVKTSLIVARRIPRRESAFNRDPCETFLRLRISGRAQGPNGVIDRLYPGKTHKESFFAEQARTWLSSGAGHKDELVEAFHVPVARVAVNLLGVCTKQAWFSGMEDFQSGGAMFTPLVPQELADWLALRTENFPVVSLESLGVSVGQGLRTGANRFFYADALTESDRTVELSFNWYAKDVLAKAPSSCALPVLRRQAELPDGYVVRASNLKGRVLALQGAALTEDIEAGGEVARRAFMSMPDSLASLVRAAAKANFGAQNEPKRIYELTAVAPNIRKANATKGTPPRFWYMLPDFSARHRPDLLIARINNASPKAFINEGREALVDANFSTIWLNGTPHVDAHAMLALLNSSWCRAVLELSASIMGGGALKVEATHLRRLPIPIMAAKDWKALSGLGRKLASTKTEVQNKDVLRRIDYFVASALLRRAASETDTGRLRGLATEGMLRRQNHKQKG